MIIVAPKSVPFNILREALDECQIDTSSCPRVGRKVVDGWYLPSQIVIKNTPRTTNVILNLIHEAIHHLYPKMTETQVEELAKRSFSNCTTREIWLLERYVDISSRAINTGRLGNGRLRAAKTNTSKRRKRR